MILTAKLLLDTGGFTGPARGAIDPLRRVKNELTAVGREAEKVAAGSGRLALPAAAAAGAGGVAAGAGPAIAALVAIRSQTIAVAQEMRRAAAPVAELRASFRQLSLEGGGRGGRPMINVTPIAGARAEMVLARQELARYVAAQRLALGGGEAASSRMVYAPIGRRITGADTPAGGAGAGVLGGVAGSVMRAAAPIAAAAAVIGTAFKSIKAASQMEDFETSFSTLLGGIDQARERMGELATFAKDTPFELPEVAQASRVLETLTQGALSTGAGLRMVGDTAANVKEPIQELSVWIGRTYDGLMNGRPIGEALMRLQELGIMSGKTRTEIEQLQEQGKRGAEVWGVAAASFARFSGEMERRSATVSGRFSNLKDSASAVLREMGGPLAAAANEPLRRTSLLLDGIAEQLRDVKRFWLEAFGVVPDGKFPGPAAKPKPAPAGAGSQQEISAALNQFFGPLDQLSGAKRSMKDSMASFADARAQRVLQDPFSNDADRERALLGQARRAFKESGMRGQQIAPGVTADPQSVDDALQRVDAEMKLLETMKEHNAFAGLTAEKMEKLTTAYEKLVQLATQLNGIRKSAVDRALEDFFGPMDKRVKSWDAATPKPPTDNLARIGLFIGAGGAGAEHSRQTAHNTAQAARFLQKLVEMPPTAISAPGSSWGVQHG